MPRSTSARTPTYRKHKASGQAIVTLAGRDFYLGPFGTKASRLEYDRVVAEWMANGRSLPSESSAHTDFTVNEIAIRYLEFAEGYYRKNGQPTGTVLGIKAAFRFLCGTYGRTPAREFGPLALAALQAEMIKAEQTRIYINNNIDRIRRCFKWAVSQELIPVAVYQALTTVPGLRRGRTAARENPPVRPVPEEVVAATLVHARPVVGDMVRLQRLAGCRPGEVCLVRPCDVDRTGDVWEYRPQSHKTEHHGHPRVILLGPQAQAILRPYLDRPADQYCFSPAESERAHNAERRAGRKSPMTPSQAARRSKKRPSRAPGDRYTTASFRRAVQRARELADRQAHAANPSAPIEQTLVPPWSPKRLRNSAGTAIRKRFGAEASRVTLGHARLDVTEIYAERDMQKAAEVMRELG